MTPKVKAFGLRPKWWREQRGLSKFAFSGAAGISQRHLSFLESGHAKPSRDMVP
jgi:transcriptional regulator with XRE-family HTH domain